MNENPWHIGRPTKDGIYFVSIKAPQKVGGYRIYFVAKWLSSGMWLGLPAEWGTEISQWMEIPPPLPEPGDNSGN